MFYERGIDNEPNYAGNDKNNGNNHENCYLCFIR